MWQDTYITNCTDVITAEQNFFILTKHEVPIILCQNAKKTLPFTKTHEITIVFSFRKKKLLYYCKKFHIFKWQSFLPIQFLPDKKKRIQDNSIGCYPDSLFAPSTIIYQLVCLRKRFFNFSTKVGFIYTFWNSLLSTSSILE